MSSTYKTKICQFVAGFVIATQASTQVITVDPSLPPNPPTTVTTITQALAQVQPGGIIDVAPGFYSEGATLTFPAFDITLQSLEGAAATILDGDNGGYSIIRVPAAATRDTVIRNFTITRGGGLSGGGISCEGGSPTISGNIIVDNSTLDQGGGIACVAGAAPLITGNMLIDNRTVGNLAGGSGIACIANSNADIFQNRIIFNRGFPGTRGSGIAIADSSPLVRLNNIRGNTTGHVGGGLHISGLQSSPTIYANRIYDNLADDGGGAYVTDDATPTFFNNSFSGNVADDLVPGGYSFGRGGAIYVEDASPTLIHETLTGNEAANFGGGLGVGGQSLVTLRNCIIYGNTELTCCPMEYEFTEEVFASQSQLDINSCLIGPQLDDIWDYDPTLTSFTGDPLFNDADADVAVNNPQDPNQAPFTLRDLHLQAGSPAINAGFAAGTTAEDMEGNPSFAPCDTTPDIGADEAFAHLYIVGGVSVGQVTTLEESASASVRVVGPPGEFAVIGQSSGLGVPAPQACDTEWLLDLSSSATFSFTAPFVIPASGILELPLVVPTGMNIPDFFTEALVGTTNFTRATLPTAVVIVPPGGNDLP